MDGLRIEDLLEGPAGSMEAGLDGAGLDMQVGGDFGDGPVELVMEEDGLAEGGGEAAYCGVESGLALAGEERPVRGEMRGGGDVVFLLGEGLFPRVFAEKIAGDIGGDGKEPRGERAAVIEAGEVEVGFHKSVLGEVRGCVFICCVTAEEADELGAMFPDH